MTTGLNTIVKLYTINQVAEVLAVSKITVYRLVETRKIPFYKIKGCIRFTEKDIFDYLNQSRIESVE